VNTRLLFRLAAICDVAIALFVGVLSGAELYLIRSGQFHNSNWLEPVSWARTQEWGLYSLPDLPDFGLFAMDGENVVTLA